MTAASPVELVGEVRRGLGVGADDASLGATLGATLRARVPLSGSADLLDAMQRMHADVVGAGPLEQLLGDPEVSDILVNGPGPVWVDRGAGVVRSDLRIDDESALRSLAQRLAAACDRRLDDACPFVDARLPGGVRVHAVLAPVAPQGTTLSLRIPPRRTFTLAELVARAALPPDGADLLRLLVQRRVAFVVTGGTGTGKTTVLSTLLSQVDERERLVLVEDAPELRPTHGHVVRLQTRQPNAEGAGAVVLSTLVRQALRMRPDRLVVGEVRGAEVVDLLAAMNTGHEGGAATLHANRSEHVPARFEALCAAAGLSREAAHAQVAAAVQAIVQLTRGPDGRRRVAGVAVLAPSPDGTLRALPAQAFGTDGLRPAAAAADLAALLGTA